MSQVITKFIADAAITTAKIAGLAVDSTKLNVSAVTTTKIAINAVTGAKIRLNNNEVLKAFNAASSGNVDIIKVDTSDRITLMGDLYPVTPGTTKLGNTSFTFGEGYFDNLKASDGGQVLETLTRIISDTGGNTSVDAALRQLKDSGSAVTMDYEGHVMNDTAGNTAMTFTAATRMLYDTAASPSIDFANRFLYDTVGALSIDWANRQILNTAADPVIDYNTLNHVQLLSSSGTTVTLGFYDQDNNRKVSIKSPDVLVTDYTITLPPDDGTTGQVLTTDGAGVTTWTTVSGSSITFNKETFTLSGTDITNQYVDLAHVAKTGSIIFMVKGAGNVLEGASFDYSVNYTGGAGGNTRLTFLNDLATGGAAALIAGDILQINYSY